MAQMGAKQSTEDNQTVSEASMLRIFRLLDTDHSGFIEFDELKHWVSRDPKFEKEDPEDKTKRLMEVVDKDQDGKISSQDFVAHFKQLNSDKFDQFFESVKCVELAKIQEVFKLLDLDGNQYIDRTEFTDWCKNEVTLSSAEEEKLFDKLDHNKNDKISLEEFVEYYKNFTEEQVNRITDQLYKRHAKRLASIREAKEDMDLMPDDEAEALAAAQWEEQRLARQPDEAVPPKKQRETIRKIMDDNTALKAGDMWYVISFKWWQLWSEFVQYEADKPSAATTDKDGDVDTDLGPNEAPTLDRSVSFSYGQEPGAIDNKDLVGERPGELKLGLQENYDYVVLPKDAWDHLREWYGGGPVFARRVITVGQSNDTRVELWPYFFVTVWAHSVTGAPNPSTVSRNRFSRQSTFGDVVASMAEQRQKELSLEEKLEVRLWIKEAQADDAAGDGGDENPAKFKWILVPEEEMKTELQQSTQIAGGDTLLFEAKNEVGKFPRDTTTKVKKNFRDFEIGDVIDAQDTMGKWYESTVRDVKAKENKIFVHFEGWSSKWDQWFAMDSDALAPLRTHTTARHKPRENQSSWAYQRSANQAGDPLTRGVVGLRNLGNTCFMNSTLQCLSNTQPLTDYFLQGRYKNDVNKDNPLGHMGRVAEEWAGLLRDIWSNKYAVVAPSQFKRTIGEFAPRFSGFQQQDSSELLSFLLDGLHEDLNRVKKKPYTQDVESKGRSDEVVSKEAWETYQKRNKSVITDLMTGQLKSTIVCPIKECGRVSVKFDPFLFLSLPLPVVNTKTIAITFIPVGKNPMVYGVEVNKRGWISNVKEALANMTGVDMAHLRVADMLHHRVYRELPNRASVRDIRATDVVYAYEVPELKPVASDPVTDDSWKNVQKGSLIDALDTDNVWYESHVMEVKDDGKEILVHYSGWSHKWDEWLNIDSKRVGYKNQHSKPAVFTVCVTHCRQAKNPHYIADSRYPTAEFVRENFGVPFYFSFQSNALTGRQVYEQIAERVKGYTKPAASADDSKLPFEVVILNQAGNGCGLCRKRECSGCVLPADDTLLEGKKKVSWTLNWTDPSRYDAQAAETFERHESAPLPEADADAAMSSVSLDDCFQQFTKQEILGKDDLWYCSDCKEFRAASKKFDVYNVPEVLVLHLKRFSYTEHWREKLDTFIDFPLDGLDLSKHVKGHAPNKVKPVYDCIGVSNHFGGLGGGHYTAYVRNPDNGNWYNCDDSRVTPIAAGQVKTKSAYLLFYRLRMGNTASTNTAAASSSS